MNTTLERALSLNTIKSAEILIEHILAQKDSIKYKFTMMRLLPDLLKKITNVRTNFSNFFTFPTVKDGYQNCGLEHVITDPKALVFSKSPNNTL